MNSLPDIDMRPDNVSRDEIVARLRAEVGSLRNLDLTSVSIFGSRARGDHRPDSDLDLLVDYDTSRKSSLLDLVRAERILGVLIGCPVQITTRSSLSQADQPRIEREVIAVV